MKQDTSDQIKEMSFNKMLNMVGDDCSSLYYLPGVQVSYMNKFPLVRQR